MNIGTVEEQNEFHPNGELAYIQTIKVIDKQERHLYPNYRIHSGGYLFIRTGLCAKYYNNGQLAWSMNYDDMGNVIKDNQKSFRKNGDVIKY